MDIPIIFEDPEFLVIDKPFGIIVNKSDTTKDIETIQDWAEEKYSVSSIQYSGDEESIAEFKSRGGVVHRLDKDTSGLLVIAKNHVAFENLKNQFKERSTIKKYLALVHGKVEPPNGRIDAPIDRSPFNRMHFGIFPSGREAQTDYKTLRNYQLIDPNKTIARNSITLYTFLEVTPHTGRTHQIRVHLKHLNHPIVSDPIYGGRKNYQNDLSFCPRLFLHAGHLEIKNPKTGMSMVFDSPLPEDLQTTLDKLN